jgi:hypothetical protein
MSLKSRLDRIDRAMPRVGPSIEDLARDPAVIAQAQREMIAWRAGQREELAAAGLAYNPPPWPAGWPPYEGDQDEPR